MKAFKNALQYVHLGRRKGRKGVDIPGNEMQHPPGCPSCKDVKPELKNLRDSALTIDAENSDMDGGGRADGGVTKKRMVIYNNPEEFGSPDTSDEERFVEKKSSETIALLEKALQKHFLFSCLEPSEIRACFDVMFMRSVHAGEDIVVQGEEGKEFYVLESGLAEVFVDGTNVASYEPGGSFGELALVYHAPRAATVRASTPCVLWYVKLCDFRQLLASAASGTMLKRCEFLSRIPLIRNLSKAQISKLADALKRMEFDEGTYIIRQGETGNMFYLIESGNVCCTQYKSATDTTEVPLLNLKEGDYFGEMALMLEEPRAAHCIAVTGPVSCLCLSRIEFFTLLGPIQNVLQNNMRVRILKSVPLLSSLTDVELCRIADALSVRSFKEQEYICTQGAYGTQFFVINEGMVKIVNNSGDSKGQIELGKGDYFGERALIKNEKCNCDVIAVGKVDCLVLEQEDFHNLLTPLMNVMQLEIDMRSKDWDFNKSEKTEGDELEKPDAPVVRKGRKVEFESLEQISMLGVGTFGRVKLVQVKETGQCYALKCMQKSQIAKSFQRENVMNEKNILFSCDHPFIMNLISTFNRKHEVFMLTELILGGELWSYIYKKITALPRSSIGGFTTEVAKFYTAGVILTLDYLHSHNIAYHDVKPENVLVNLDGFVKCVDFGFAKYIPFMHKNKLRTKSFTICGTPDYLAPEIILSRGHDRSVDYWSLGCFVFELLVGKTPFVDSRHTEIFKKAIRSDQFLTFPKGFDPNAEDLIRRLLRSNCAFRLGNLGGGTSDIISHPWFVSTGFDFHAMLNKTMKPPFIPKVKDPTDTRFFTPIYTSDRIIPYTGDDAQVCIPLHPLLLATLDDLRDPNNLIISFADCYYSELIHFGSSVEHVQRSDLKAQCRMY